MPETASGIFAGRLLALAYQYRVLSRAVAAEVLDVPEAVSHARDFTRVAAGPVELTADWHHAFNGMAGMTAGGLAAALWQSADLFERLAAEAETRITTKEQ